MNPFLRACGADGPLQLVIDPAPAGASGRLEFEQPFVLVGRDPLSDLVLERRDVSDRHAYLQYLDGRLFCVDLGSRIGTHFGGKCQRSGWLGQRQGVRIGSYRIRLGAPADAPAALSGATPEHARPRLVVELSHRGLRNTLCPIEERIALIGSAADCVLRILDPSVSNYHCSLLSTAQGVWVVDLLGQGGVALNGNEVRFARVYDGDELRVGSSALRLRYEFLSGPSRTRGVEPARTLATLAAPPPEAAPEPQGPPEPADLPAPAPLPCGVDLKPLLAGYPDATAELVASIVAPLVGQFGLMQQQMLDQFQQAGTSMFQAFANQHQEQLGSLREELDRLRELSEELDWLRAQMTFHLPAPHAQARPTREPNRSAGAKRDENGAGARNGHGQGVAPAGGAAPASGRLGSARVGPTRPGAPSGALALLAAEAELPPMTVEEPPPAPILPFERPPSPTPPLSFEIGPEPDRGSFAERVEAAPEFGDEPVHDYLTRRMALIEGEREGRWQKILRMMPAAAPKKSSV